MKKINRKNCFKMNSKTPIRFFEAVFLDFLALPGKFMTRKGNAELHLSYICPLCSNWRKKFRNPERKSNCLWEEAWKNGKYNFPRNFGFLNWIRYYLGMRTNLEKYKARAT